MARRGAVLPQNTLDVVPFERLGISVPETREEAEKAIEVIMTTQKSILTCYLESLQLPDVAASVKEACIIRQSDVGESESNAEHASDADSDAASPSTTFESPIASTQHILQPLDLLNAKGFGNWSINIAQRAEKDLRHYYHRNRSTFNLIVKKMRELSNGNFRQENHSQLNSSHVEIPIYAARVTGDLRVVYQIDCTPIYETKVFGVYDDEPVSGSFWSSVGRELRKKGEEYKYRHFRCTLRQRSYGSEDGDVFIPATFPPLGEIQMSSDGVPDLPSDDVEQSIRHVLTLTRKTVHFSQPLLESIIADLDVQFVLQISPREQTIIQYPFSCYVLGKTTTMLYKMLLVEVSTEFAIAETPKLRQLFVTQSRILAEKVGEHFAKLLAGYEPTAMSQTLKAAKKADRALVDEDEENEWRTDLPKRFSDLADEDFPLFVSFNQLCTLIERDMEADSASACVARKPTARLTYDKFQQAYWPHFPQNLTKGLGIPASLVLLMPILTVNKEPSLVFSEILDPFRPLIFLDRGTYLALGERSQSTFADQRNRIYDLFESYLAKKRVQGDTDAADRTHAILAFFRNHGIPGRKIHYLYVDEVQDNLLVDTLLLRSICQNPNGLFWAGDTAQTISVGSSFRFNELKAFLFRVEKQRQKKHPELDYHPVERPQQFQLTVNYRSHAGIVNCARTVIEVITKLWPNSIDLLERERGTVDGLRPIFFINWDSEQSSQLLFGDHETGQYVELGAHQCILVRNDITKANLQKQVGGIGLIMTLNECKGLEFNDVIIYNFFNDSNMSESQWRVVLNALESGSDRTITLPKCDSRHTGVCAELKFLYVAITRARNKVWIVDCSFKGEPMRRHKTLWTSKNQVQNCALGIDTPRFAISSTPQDWEERGGGLFNNKHYSQAKLCYERAYLPRKAAIASAYHMRQEAGDMVGGTHRENATRRMAFQAAAAAFLDCGRANSSTAYFRISGECFEQAGDDTAAIQAYTDAEEFTKVVKLYLKLEQFDEAVATIQKYCVVVAPRVDNKVINVARLFYFKREEFKKATALFSSNEESLEFLKTYGMDATRVALLEYLGRFSDAAELHLKLEHFDEAAAMVQKYCDVVAPRVYNKVINVARLFYLKREEFKKATALFSSHEESLEFLKTYGMDATRVALLEYLGRFSDAAELHLKLEHFDEAVVTVQKYCDVVAPRVYNKVINVARLFYFKREEFKKATALFSSHEESLEFLKTYGMDATRAALFEYLERFSDAAELHLVGGRTLDAIALFLRDRQDTREQSMRRAGKLDMTVLSKGSRDEVSFLP
ncbi:P-loop containing nucleoside triphosphate hydrolase protein [Mycena rebaudengoi]|nr:P-loop containing nucleoside triphosphate hydrolase protein [Mycena rebaudengoi]